MIRFEIGKTIKKVERTMRFSCALAMLVFAASANAQTASTSQAKVELSRIGDATHLEFSGLSDWKYDLKRNGDQVTLRLPQLTSESRTKLGAQIDPLIKGVKINPKAIDDSTEITFTVTDKADFFDYIAEGPSRLVVDFFPKEESAKAAAKPVKPAAATQLKVLANPAAKVAVADPEADEDDEEEEAPAPAKQLPSKKARKPAGADFIVVAKGELPQAPSLAEQLSSKKDFSHGIFDGGDPEFRRFSIKDYEIKEDAEIASRRNYYLPFPMLELGLPQLKALIEAPPTYEIVANDTRENKEARILLTLFSKHQRALFLKLADDFVQKYPDSAYDEIVRYMMADAHYDIWRANASMPDFELAMNNYLALSEKYPTSPMTPRSLLLMGYSYLDRGDSFGALKAFGRFARQFPNSKQIDRVNISIAEAYLKLNRFDDALILLDQVERQGHTEKGKEEAAYRKGDVAFRKRDFAEAINLYKGAIARHPAAASRFPNASYNTAEAEFILKKYRDGLDAYRSFLQKFPDSDHGGYAMTRLGEILGILGADPERAQGAFLESYFRYRSTPGAGVARIRTLTSRMPEMKEKEVASALSEIEQITAKYANRPKTKKEIEAELALAKAEAEAAAHPKKAEGGEGGEGGGEGGEGKEKKVEVAKKEEPAEGDLKLIPKVGEDPTEHKPELPGIEEFSTLLIADAHTARHEYDMASNDLIAYYQKNPQTPNKDKFVERIVSNLADGVASAIDRGDFIDGLRRYSKHADGWFKNTDRVDVGYNVARGYEQAGVFKEAASGYREAMKRLAAIKAAKKEREHEIFEHLPKADELELRLAATAAKQKDFAGAEADLKKISPASQLTDKEKIERAEVSADVAEARGETDAARKYLASLVKTWEGDPVLTSPLHLRLAKLEGAAKNYKAADQHLATIQAWKKDEDTSAQVSDDVHAAALEMRGDFLVQRGKRSEAIKTYRDLLETYEAKRPLASVRYRLGQMLFQDGDLKQAESVWSELKPGKDGLWQRLANEQMSGAKWQREYKKYIDRIPAAADLRADSKDSNAADEGQK